MRKPCFMFFIAHVRNNMFASNSFKGRGCSSTLLKIHKTFHFQIQKHNKADLTSEAQNKLILFKYLTKRNFLN